MRLFEKQIFHFAALAVLLKGTLFLAAEQELTSQILGIPAHTWFLLAILIPVLHQVYVWLIWRLELKYNLLSQIFGNNGFTLYAIGFTILFVSRLIAIVILALADQNSLHLMNATISYVTATVFLLLSAYLFYSVKQYFGFRRAYGIDHFDSSYRTVPFVREGIFKITGNAMYTFGFLILWVPGLLFFSRAALVAALFNHLYIWVHYLCTERPDIQYIYRK